MSGPEAAREVVEGMKVEMKRGGALPVHCFKGWIDPLEPCAAPKPSTEPRLRACDPVQGEAS